MNILLHNAEDAEEFVTLASDCPFPVKLRAGSIYLNGKSLLGVLASGLNEKLTVETPAHAQDDMFFECIEKFAA